MKTYLDWSAYKDAGMGDAYADIPKLGGDFAKAVAVCINSRQCETKGRGVMCPSYRVTDNPALSPGGRVKLLKRVLNSEDESQLTVDRELSEAMELCLSCKGCKRECENNVDMAQIKIEYLAQRNAVEGIPWRTRLFANLPLWLHRMPWLENLIVLRNRTPWLAKLSGRLLGISPGRRLPLSTTERHRVSSNHGGSEQNEVVLFIDTFTHYYDPQIADSAVAVLQAGGYRVFTATTLPTSPEAARPLCCGRTFIAHGMLDEARTEARRTLDALIDHARAGRTIVGLEPACLLALRDDYLSMDLGEDAELVSKQSILFEEFIAREQKAKRMQLPLKALENMQAPLLVHGHCHQKAVGAMKSMRKVLKMIPGLEFEFIESSCCGMGGSFGLEKEHEELSMKMAEQSLLPTIRKAKGAAIIANGFACREQILAGSERKAKHIAVILGEALV